MNNSQKGDAMTSPGQSRILRHAQGSVTEQKGSIPATALRFR